MFLPTLVGCEVGTRGSFLFLNESGTGFCPMGSGVTEVMARAVWASGGGWGNLRPPTPAGGGGMEVPIMEAPRAMFSTPLANPPLGPATI